MNPITLTCVHSPDPVRYGENVVYSLTITNPNTDMVTSVRATFSFDPNAGFEYIAASDAGFAMGSVVTWDVLGTLGPGASRTVSVTLQAPVGMSPFHSLSSTVTVTATSDETFGSEMPVDHVTNVLPWADLECTIGCPASVSPGSQFTYSIHITNNCGIVVTSLRFIAQLSSHVTFVSASDTGTFYPVTGSGGMIRWEGGPWSLNPGQTKTFTAVVTVNANAPVGSNAIKIVIVDLLADESTGKGPVEAFSSVEKGSSWKGLGILGAILDWLFRFFRVKKP
jgi:uncharacterized repeat protein (TIGR01451 family)